MQLGIRRDHGLYISPSAIFEITNRTAQALSLEWIKIAKRLRKRKAVNVDETGIKVNGKKYWIWIFTTKKETLVAIRKSRGCDVPKEILGENFKGIIISDGWRVILNSLKGFRDAGHTSLEKQGLLQREQKRQYL